MWCEDCESEYTGPVCDCHLDLCHVVPSLEDPAVGAVLGPHASALLQALLRKPQVERSELSIGLDLAEKVAPEYLIAPWAVEVDGVTTEWSGQLRVVLALVERQHGDVFMRVYTDRSEGTYAVHFVAGDQVVAKAQTHCIKGS